MKNGLYSILVLALFTLSCSEQQYFVKGKSTQSTIDGEYAYMGPMNSPQVLYFDSCRVVHGKFEMTGPLDSVLCVTIYMGSMRIPMVPQARSLNLSNCVAICVYVVQQQTGFAGLSAEEVIKGADYLSRLDVT